VTAIVAAACGVALAALALSVAWRRMRLARKPGIIRCKLRPVKAGSERRVQWPRYWAYGEWVHDVLVVHRGMFLGQTVALPIRFPEGVVQCERHGLAGARYPARLRLRLDDGSVVELAVTKAGRPEIAGPFLAVAALDARERAMGE
jgi:hypothetical protein